MEERKVSREMLKLQGLLADVQSDIERKQHVAEGIKLAMDALRRAESEAAFEGRRKQADSR